MSGGGPASEAVVPLWQWSGTREPAGVEALAVRVALFAVAHEDGARMILLWASRHTPAMFSFVKRRVLDAETADRVELRLLEGHPELGYHWVDVPGRGVQAACGLYVDSHGQWKRHEGTSSVTVCRSCDQAMPSPRDVPLGG